MFKVNFLHINAVNFPEILSQHHRECAIPTPHIQKALSRELALPLEFSGDNIQRSTTSRATGSADK